MHKTIRCVAVAALAFASPALYALGLGSAKVDSFLNQPLDVRVELISQSSEELQSVTAGLASAKDFELLGLKMNSISVPLDFEIISEGGKSYIHITSNLNVGNPVMQVLVEVVWANGRMLREYTLFLDPPTFDSKAPAAQVTRPAAAQTVAPPPVAVQTPPQERPSGQSVPTAPLTSGGDTPPSADVSAGGLVEPPAAPNSDQEGDTAGVTGRVGKGQTLWGIASDWSRGTGYNVNQVMIAIQQKNPDAFIDDNINLLKQGEILRMPVSDEMAAITTQQAALEVQRQAAAFSPALSIDYATPTVADSGDYQEAYQDSVPEDEQELAEGRLEIVPPADADADTDTIGAISQTSDEGTVDSQALQEKLSRTEEDLINAELENSYLKDRISALEQQAEAAKNAQIQDADLAGMQQALADKQASEEPEPPIALTVGGESQPWYAGATIWLLAAALFLILLLVWFLRRKSFLDSRKLQEIESRSTVQAVTDDAEDLLDILGNYESAPITSEVSTTHTSDEQDIAAHKSRYASESEDNQPSTAADVKPVAGVVATESDLGAESAGLAGGPAGHPVETAETDLDNFDFAVGTDAADLGTLDDDTRPSSGAQTVEDDEDGEPLVAESEEANDPELKLDLARAYLSLGDKEAAKSMLDEVLLNGNDDQVDEAKQMLEEL